MLQYLIFLSVQETDGKSKKRKVGLALHPKKDEEEVPAEEAPKDEPKNNKSKSESTKSESSKLDSTKTPKDASGAKKGLMSHVCTYLSVLVSFSGFKDDDPKYTCALREKLTAMIYTLKGEVIKYAISLSLPNFSETKPSLIQPLRMWLHLLM